MTIKALQDQETLAMSKGCKNIQKATQRGSHSLQVTFVCAHHDAAQIHGLTCSSGPADD